MASKNWLTISGLAFLLVCASILNAQFGRDGYNPPSGGGTVTVPVQTLVHDTHNEFCSMLAGAVCSITIPATTAGNLLSVFVAPQNNVTVASISDGSSTYMLPAGCQNMTSALYTGCGYTLSVAGGITTLTVTFSGAPGAGFQFNDVLEYHKAASGTFTFDTSGTAACSGVTNVCLSTNLTLGASPSDIIVVFMNPAGSCVGGPASFFTNPEDDSVSGGWCVAGAVNQTAFAPINFFLTSGMAGITSAMAFK